MTRLFAALGLVMLLGLPCAARADLPEAIASYDAGDFKAAFDAFAELAAGGDGTAMLYMAHMYEAGEGAPLSRPSAVTWYRRAAAHDNAEAAFRLGQMYETGIGVARDYTAAVNAYQQASDLGSLPATVALADLYVGGNGAMPDPSHAARLLKSAADAGDPDAQVALARLVESGMVPLGVLDDLGIPPPPPPTVPTVEELAAEELEAEAAAIAASNASGMSSSGSTGSGSATESEAGSDDGTMAALPEANGSAAAAGGEPLIMESETAARLRAAFESTLPNFEGATRLDHTLTIDENPDGSMVLTLGDIEVHGPEATWMIGDIVYDLRPIGDERYATTATFPTTTTIYDNHGMAIGGTTIGSQDVSGVFDLADNMWTSLAGGLHEIGFVARAAGEPEIAFALSSIDVSSQMDKSAAGKWDGGGRISLEGLTIAQDGVELGHLGSLVATMGQRAMDYVVTNAVRAAQAEFAQRFGPRPDMEDPSIQAAMAELARPIIALMRARAPLVGDLGFSIDMHGIAGQDPDTGAPFSLDDMTLAMSGEGLDQPNGTVNLAYAHTGLQSGLPDIEGEFMPTDAAFVVALRDMPTEAAARMTLEMIEGSLDDPANFASNMDMALGFMVLGLQQQMATVGSTIDIQNISYSSAALQMTITGKLVADAESPYGAVGTVSAEIVGLEAAVAGLSANTDNPDAQDMAMPLTMLQAMGKRVEENGTVKHVYVIELTPDGRSLLNGNDMGPMLDSMMGGADSSTIQ